MRGAMAPIKYVCSNALGGDDVITKRITRLAPDGRRYFHIYFFVGHNTSQSLERSLTAHACVCGRAVARSGRALCAALTRIATFLSYLLRRGVVTLLRDKMHKQASRTYRIVCGGFAQKTGYKYLLLMCKLLVCLLFSSQLQF